MKIRKLVLTRFCIVAISSLSALGVNAQTSEFSKNSIKVGVGIGAYFDDVNEGFGALYSVGYQREIWKDRLRFNPNFSIGNYTAKNITDVPDLYFTSSNLEANLNYDLVRVNAFSLVVACGAAVNRIKGLKGTGGDGDVPKMTSSYISNYRFGANLAGGFRVNLPDKRTVINIIPINFRFGTKNLVEAHAKIELDFKF